MKFANRLTRCSDHLLQSRSSLVVIGLQPWGFSLGDLAILCLDRGSQMWCVSGICRASFVKLAV